MMTKLTTLKNVLLALVAVAALFMATQPFGTMSSSTEFVTACVVLALSALVSLIVLRDKPQDEREASIIAHSEKWGFVAGVIALSAGILWGAFNDSHNGSLEVILGIMVLTKLFASYYLNNVK